jgi:hypothetical protein
MLYPTATLVVTVLAEGEPCAGRIVSVQEAVPDSAETGLTTGEDGKATFRLAPEKQYRLSSAVEAGSATEQASIFVPGGQITEYTFAFHRIFGHIVDAVGNPVRQRPLSVRMSTAIQSDDVYHGPQMDDTQTSVDPQSGEFWLLAAPGTYLLECLEQGAPLSQQRVTVKHAAIHVSLTLFEQPAAS